MMDELQDVDTESDVVNEMLSVGVEVAMAVPVAVTVAVFEALLVAVAEAVSVAVPVGVSVAELDTVNVAVIVSLALLEDELVTDALKLIVPERVGVEVLVVSYEAEGV